MQLTLLISPEIIQSNFKCTSPLNFSEDYALTCVTLCFSSVEKSGNKSSLRIMRTEGRISFQPKKKE